MLVTSFNVRREFSQDGKYTFANRKDFILETILKKKPDIIGFQEVLPDVLAWLKEKLGAYLVVGCGRDKNLQDEATAIAINKKRFDLVEMKTFWLSSTPRRPGSRYFMQSICPRTCTEVLLHDLKSGKPLRVFNTHLDHIGKRSRLHSVKQIMKMEERQRLLGNAPFLLMGDFNAYPDAPEVQILSKKYQMQDLTAAVGGTFHGFGEIDPPTKIDYIFASKEIAFLKAGRWDDLPEGLYLSDHYPVFVDVSLAD